MLDLKPCPFCGQEPMVTEEFTNEIEPYYYYLNFVLMRRDLAVHKVSKIECGRCGVTMEKSL